MPPDLSKPWTRVQLAALALLVAFIVAAPFALLRAAHQESLAVIAQADHAREVESAIRALAYEVRTLESATLAAVADLPLPEEREGIEASLQRIPELLDTLARLTQDNPSQQVRIGEMQVTARQRMARAGEILSAPDQAARRQLATNVARRFPFRDLAQAMLDEETRLRVEREGRAAKLQTRTNALFWVVIIAQAGLLGLLALFLRRQHRRRLSAESDALRASGRALAILQTVREPIALVDSGQCVVMHNLAFAETYGVEEGETAVDRPLTSIGGGAWQHAEFLQRLKDVLGRDRELWDFELVQKTGDGVERVMLVNARRMSLPDRVDDVALLTLNDVTTQKSAERQIRDLNRQLSGKVEQVSDVNRELEAFSYSVSHDLRAPLRHIAGFAHKLGKHLGDDADEKSVHYIDVIERAAHRMSALIDDLLVYSRLGRSAMRLQAVDMQSMVDETRALLDSNLQVDAPGRRVQWKIAPLPILVADENMMRQVWLNLMGNAVKYSATRDPAVIEIQHERDDDGGHRFTVRDNGAGFDMQYAGKLFGVFQRLHSATEYSGTGIGLASVRRVLTRHGGTISADARPDEGATFTFTLPSSLDTPGAHEKTP
ncbi:CHASE3 domain-containing protein [Lysobacter sp. SG-8]|uniref:histidine kinase n=1 Tax=Marilutibacter penaei TaxID=2759900 RepID=A0A7W3U3B2_9GAMM|nr:ATP-binding protein [Lysobacter penaei]MBB1088161.1 CHASE3 domain-containing protein [Lysobacter penaei]